MNKTDSEMLNKYKERIKKQNEKIKEGYDRVTATLPKGTVNRIKALGLTINGVINESVLVYLDCMEKQQAQPEEATKQPQIEPTVELVEETLKKTEKLEFKPVTKEENEEFLRFLSAKRAECGIREEDEKKNNDAFRQQDAGKMLEKLKDKQEDVSNFLKTKEKIEGMIGEVADR